MTCRKLFMAVAVALVALVPAAKADMWINEFHYDNGGADAGEFVEVVVNSQFFFDNPGASLGDITLTLYNGNGGGSYDIPHTLDTFTEHASVLGHRIFTKDIAGIQNGSPDGMALDFSGTVFEFISYEGSFNATDGPANGLASTDIGVAEDGGTAIGESLQLSGTGNESGDFTWNAAAAETKGALNTNQSFTAIPEPASAGLIGLVGLGLLAYRRRK